MFSLGLANSRCLRRLAVGLLLGVTLLSATAGAHDVLPWKRPLPGTRAFLGDDGGGENFATVCGTAADYREWLNYGHPPGCRRFHRGLPVVIQGVLYDARKDRSPGTRTWLPLVKISIPSAGMTGYVQLLGGLHPSIPRGAVVHLQGAVVHLQKEGTDVPHLAPSRYAPLDGGVDLGDYATGNVIRYDPSTSGRELFVVITDGAFAHRRGWVFTLGAESGDGEPVSVFDQSVLKVPRPPPIDRRAKLYVIRRPLRAFMDMAVCQAADVAVSNDRAFKELDDAYASHRYYDFRPGTHLHVVADSGPGSPYIMVADDHGHEGCVSRFALPGYAIP